jgi:hypothetical protein
MNGNEIKNRIIIRYIVKIDECKLNPKRKIWKFVLKKRIELNLRQRSSNRQ